MLLPKQSRMTMAGITVACSLFLVACSPKETVQLNLIPLPAQFTVTDGFFKADSAAVFSTEKPANVHFVVDKSLGGNPEGYQLTVNDKGIDLKAATIIYSTGLPLCIHTGRTSSQVPWIAFGCVPPLLSERRSVQTAGCDVFLQTE